METQYAQFRIVADSAANITALKHVHFQAAPLKVRTEHKEYLDSGELDIAAMVEELKAYKGKSTSSCPNPDEWLAAFGDAQYVFAVTLTSGLSGSYNAAQAAKQIYESEFPGRHVFLLDSLSAGPEEALLVEQLEQLILSGMGYEEICREIQKYQKETALVFMLESLTNFANNGRVSPAVAKVVGLLGINIVGKASAEGTLEPMEKCRGQKKAIEAIVSHLKQAGFSRGKLRIAHCFNENAAQALKTRILESFQTSDIQICQTGGLCSFYAEKGGLLVGYERF